MIHWLIHWLIVDYLIYFASGSEINICSVSYLYSFFVLSHTNFLMVWVKGFAIIAWPFRCKLFLSCMCCSLVLFINPLCFVLMLLLLCYSFQLFITMLRCCSLHVQRWLTRWLLAFVFDKMKLVLFLTWEN